MTLTNSKINTVRNINLIYVFSTNSIFNKESNKYIGIKIVYNNSAVLEADYKDPLFGDLIKRILDRYNKEKDSRKIILLGDFTKKLVNESSFYVLDEKEDKSDQIKYYSYENKLLNKYKPYLFETINMIFKEILKCESFNILNFDGYNKSFKLDYEISGVKKSTKVMIYNKEDKMYFKMCNLETNEYISGIISETNNEVNVEYKFGNYTGTSKYDALNLDNIKKIYFNKELYYMDDNLETILDSDRTLISKYLNELGINDVKILKVNDNTYLCFYSDSVIKDGQVLYKDNLIFINLENDIIRVINNIKEGFSKYDGIVSVLLDNKEDSVTIRKLFSIDKNILIKEKCIDDDYSYELLCTDEDKNLKEDINFDGFCEEEINTIEDVKQYKKEVIK